MIISSLKTNITPTQRHLNNIRLDGYANRINYASGIHDDIYLRILHLKDQSKNIVLASLELLAVNNLWQKSAERIVKNSVITATHTHSAPRICHDYLMWGLQCNEYEIDYLNYINNTLSSSLSSVLMNQATSSIVNNILIYETEITSICRNRDNPRESSEVKAYIINDDNDIPFILHFPCHSTVLGFNNTYISGDLIGYVVSQLERESKNVVLPLIGAAGDISTRYTRVKQDFSEVERLGNQIIDLINNRKRLINEIAVKEINYKTINFSAKTRKNILINMLNSINKKSDIVRDYELNAIMNTLKVLPEKVSVKIGLLAFNKSLLFVFVPFEPTYDVQLLLNEYTHDKIVLLVGYSYDYLGYLTSQEESYTYENLMTFVHFNEIFNKIVNLIKDILL
jgi:hypothetical protein